MEENQYSYNVRQIEQQTGPDKTSLPWIEKNGFSHWAVVFGWWILGLIAFQMVANMLVIILVFPHVTDLTNTDAVLQAIQDHINLTFIANSIGQFTIIGLASYLISRLHTIKGQHHSFLRLKNASNLFQNTLLSILLLFSSVGVVQFLGWVNISFFDWLMELYPGLSFFKELQDQMAEMITGFIKSDNAIIYGVIYIALVPAIFEEVMFRGYIQRALEKSWGIGAAIIVSGFMFGAYHLQPSNLLPLSTLGILFAYVTYISDSLIPAMILHFINNGGQVVYGALNPEFLEQATTSEMDLPWFMVVLSMFITSVLLLLMYKMKTKSEV